MVRPFNIACAMWGVRAGSLFSPSPLMQMSKMALLGFALPSRTSLDFSQPEP